MLKYKLEMDSTSLASQLILINIQDRNTQVDLDTDYTS